MQLFYCKDIASGSLATLDAEESRHAVRVLRKRAGDAVDVTDGRGGLYRCTVVEADERGCVVESLECVNASMCECVSADASATNAITNLSRLHLAVASTKNPARMEWLVEKAVEVGVGEITLLQCDHSERSFLKTDRLERVALSAMKQSLHLWLPAINPAVPLREWLSAPGFPPSAQKLIAHCEADKPRIPIADALVAGRDAVVLIGPEGDFSEDEIALALETGFQPVSLGPSRLRTETAAVYAACAFSLINDCRQ